MTEEEEKTVWVQETLLLNSVPSQSPARWAPPPTAALPSPAQSRPQKWLLTLEGSSLTPDQRPLLLARPLPAP